MDDTYTSGELRLPSFAEEKRVAGAEDDMAAIDRLSLQVRAVEGLREELTLQITLA